MKLWKFLRVTFVVVQLELIIFCNREIAKDLLKNKVNNIESLKPQILYLLEILDV